MDYVTAWDDFVAAYNGPPEQKQRDCSGNIHGQKASSIAPFK